MTIVDGSSPMRRRYSLGNGAIGREIFVDESLYQEEQ